MIERETEVCVCNNLSAGDIAECIKEHGFSTLKELLSQNECPIGDKCESCQDEGYNNDGINIPLVLSLVRQGKL